MLHFTRRPKPLPLFSGEIAIFLLLCARCYAPYTTAGSRPNQMCHSACKCWAVSITLPCMVRPPLVLIAISVRCLVPASLQHHCSSCGWFRALALALDLSHLLVCWCVRGCAKLSDIVLPFVLFLCLLLLLISCFVSLSLLLTRRDAQLNHLSQSRTHT